MLSPAKKALSKYRPLLIEMVENQKELVVAQTNLICYLTSLCLLGLVCLLPLLETMHTIIYFLQQIYVFVCDYMATIKGVPRPTLWPLQWP
jgi:hypothetical protein